MAAVRLAIVVALVTSSCTPTVSRLEPYGSNVEAAGALQRRAVAVCSCLRSGSELPPTVFTTDGCSAAREGRWTPCCVEHDIAYWCGGSRDDRRRADGALERCFAGHGRTARLARFARRIVRVGGAPWLPMPWRWGYGWSGLRGYDRRWVADADACFEQRR